MPKKKEPEKYLAFRIKTSLKKKEAFTKDEVVKIREDDVIDYLMKERGFKKVGGFFLNTEKKIITPSVKKELKSFDICFDENGKLIIEKTKSQKNTDKVTALSLSLEDDENKKSPLSWDHCKTKTRVKNKGPCRYCL